MKKVLYSVCSIKGKRTPPAARILLMIKALALKKALPQKNLMTKVINRV